MENQKDPEIYEKSFVVYSFDKDLNSFAEILAEDSKFSNSNFLFSNFTIFISKLIILFF